MSPQGARKNAPRSALDVTRAYNDSFPDMLCANICAPTTLAVTDRSHNRLPRRERFLAHPRAMRSGGLENAAVRGRFAACGVKTGGLRRRNACALDREPHSIKTSNTYRNRIYMSPRFKKINALPFTNIHSAEPKILQKFFLHYIAALQSYGQNIVQNDN